MRGLALGVAFTALIAGGAAVVWALFELHFRMRPEESRLTASRRQFPMVGPVVASGVRNILQLADSEFLLTRVAMQQYAVAEHSSPAEPCCHLGVVPPCP